LKWRRSEGKVIEPGNSSKPPFRYGGVEFRKGKCGIRVDAVV
jgi:hypothetical protein